MPYRLTIPRTRGRKYCASSDVHVIALARAVAAVDRRIWIVLEIIAHVKRRSLMHESWYAHHLRRRALFLPTRATENVFEVMLAAD